MKGAVASVLGCSAWHQGQKRMGTTPPPLSAMHVANEGCRTITPSLSAHFISSQQRCASNTGLLLDRLSAPTNGPIVRIHVRVQRHERVALVELPGLLLNDPPEGRMDRLSAP